MRLKAPWLRTFASESLGCEAILHELTDVSAMTAQPCQTPHRTWTSAGIPAPFQPKHQTLVPNPKAYRKLNTLGWRLIKDGPEMLKDWPRVLLSIFLRVVGWE